jgi:hypothetical protein
MTGRRLYDHYADSAVTSTSATWNKPADLSTVPMEGILAWSVLTARDRRMWNELARRITPKPRKASNASHS